MAGMTFFSCVSTASVTSNVSDVEKFSEMQIRFATKAVKPISQNNPVIQHEFTADPCVLVYGDTVYIYGTNDGQQADFTLGKTDNNYNKIKSLKVYSSKDLVNWTDCGQINVAGKAGVAKWASNSWAPAICTKKIDGKDKFFIYFADSANGIGVITADSPLGPYSDPIGKALVNRATDGCKGVYWLFDPAVLVDDDGKGYLYLGGGSDGDAEHPKSARVVALGDDMTSLLGNLIEIDPPFLFEDSGINKINGKYYYSYCSNWSDRKNAKGNDVPPPATIAYMTSDSPLGPFTYAGYTLKNPGSYFGAWGNNHHWIFDFNGKYYIAYHSQIIEKSLGFEKGGYRSLMLNEFEINADGSWPVQNVTKAGVSAVADFNPFEKVNATTMHSCKNIIVTDKQTVCPVYEQGSAGYVCLKNVNFGNDKNSKVFVCLKIAENCKGGKISIYVDNMTGQNLISDVKIKKTGKDGAEIKSKVNFMPDGKAHTLYFAMAGDIELENWQFVQE